MTTMPQATEPQATKPVKLLIAITSGARTMENAAFLRWIVLLQRWGSQGIATVGASDGPVHIVRELLTRKFLEASEFTHLLMLDTDHLHPEDIVERLTRWLSHESRPLVVSGLNYQRKEPYRPCAFMFGPDMEILPIIRWPEGLVRVDAVGAASLLVAREVFERLEAPWWQFVYWGAQKRLVGEDIWWCRRCHDAGIPVYVDTTTSSPHLSERWIGDAEFRRWAETHKESLGPEQQIDTQLVNLSQGGTTT